MEAEIAGEVDGGLGGVILVVGDRVMLVDGVVVGDRKGARGPTQHPALLEVLELERHRDLEAQVEDKTQSE